MWPSEVLRQRFWTSCMEALLLTFCLFMLGRVFFLSYSYMAMPRWFKIFSGWFCIFIIIMVTTLDL